MTASEERDHRPQMEEGQELSVLLVEDRTDDAELIVHALRRSGFEVQWRRVETREAFLDHLHPDLDVILADYALPQFDGLEALALLRERNMDVPFILISGTIGEEAAVRAMRAGASDYLLKDRLGRLPAAVRTVLRERRLRRQRQQASEALEQSEERYRRLVEHSPAPIAVHAQGKIVYVNPATVALLGAESAGDLLGLPVLDLLHEESRPLARERIRRMQQTGEPEPVVEEKIVRLDGTVIYVELAATPISFRGQPAIQIIGHDITERKKAEEAEHRQRLFAEALADTAAVLSSSLQPATVLERLLANVGRVLPHDAADVLLLQDGVARVAEHVGYDRLDLKEVVEAMVLPLDQTPTLQYIKRTGQPLITPDIEKSRLWVGRALRPLRSVVGAPILIDGEFVGVINILSQEPNAFAERDAARLQAFAHQAAIALRNARLYQQLERHSEILEQTVAERTAELRQTKESVEAILDAIGEGVLVLDAQGRIVQVNPALEALTGYREAELVGRSYEVLAPDPTLEESLSVEILQAVQKGESWRGEAAFRPQEGAAIDVALTVAPMQETEREDAGAYVVSVRDITQMKEVERMKDSVLSITAHELRTPLTTMRLFSDLLLNRPPADEERRRQTTVIIHQQTVHLQKIVDDMLDLARLEAGRGLQIVAQPLSVRDVVQEVVQPFAEMTDKHEFQTQDVSPALTVRGDRTRLVQVVRNLVSNAVKYSPHGGTITVRCRKNDEGQVEISVADEGIGMTAEEQQRLFQKFYRADTGSGSPRGTGLGLAICKLIVEGHGGHIWVESEKGVGSTFTLSVPAADA